MKVTIAAATGGVGRELLGQALAAGHDVTAVVRNPDRLPGEVRSDGRARVVTADLARPDPEPPPGRDGWLPVRTPAYVGLPRHAGLTRRLRSARPAPAARYRPGAGLARVVVWPQPA